MSYKPNDAYVGMFTTRYFSTGVRVNADSTPTATMYRNGSSVGALTVTNVATGLYKVTGTIGSGYASGDKIQVVATATVDGVTDNAVVDSFILDSKRVGDLNDAAQSSNVNIVSVNGVAVTNISEFKADLSTLETRLSAARAGYLDKLNVSGTLAHTGNAGLFKADLTGLALEASLALLATSAELAAHDLNLGDLHTKHDATDIVLNAADAKIDIIDTNVDTSLVEHNTTQAAIAALEAKVDIIDTNVDQIETAANAVQTQTDKMQFNVSNYIYAVGSDITVGPGANAVTISVNASGLPLPDCAVWISSDALGAQTVAGTLVTNDQGDATFMLDEGLTYYLWARKSGYEPINGEAFTAVAD